MGVEVEMNRDVKALERKIEDLKDQIAAIGDLRPGTLSQQYNVCGKAGCRCKATPPQKHGPYYQLSYTRKGKSFTQFVKQQDLNTVQSQVANFSRLKELVDLWVDLATDLSNLRLQDTHKTK
jgi:hypothetical protein